MSTSTKARGPIVCKDEAEVAEAAFNGVRRRPVMAMDEKGNLVVCCRSTAKKNGWAIQGKLYNRQRSTKRIQATATAIVKDAQQLAQAAQTLAKEVLEQAQVPVITHTAALVPAQREGASAPNHPRRRASDRKERA